MFTADDVRELIRAECNYEGSQRKLAALIGIDHTHLSRILRGQKDLGECKALLDFLNLEPVTMYRKKP